MNNKPETSADIEAELRKLSVSAKSAFVKHGEYQPMVYGKPIALYFAKLADRIKAARKREKAAIEADALAVGGMVETSRKRELFTKTRKTDNSGAAIYTNDNSGNRAKLREALESCLDFIMRLDRAFNPFMQNLLEDAIAKAEAALAEPPRNCDRFGGDIDKLREACARERGLNPEEDFPDVFPDWLLAPSTAKESGVRK